MVCESRSSCSSMHSATALKCLTSATHGVPHICSQKLAFCLSHHQCLHPHLTSHLLVLSHSSLSTWNQRKYGVPSWNLLHKLSHNPIIWPCPEKSIYLSSPHRPSLSSPHRVSRFKEGCPGSSKQEPLKFYSINASPCLEPIPLTCGAQSHTVSSPIPRLPWGPVSKIPAAPISPPKLLPEELEKRESGSENQRRQEDTHHCGPLSLPAWEEANCSRHPPLSVCTGCNGKITIAPRHHTGKLSPTVQI